MSQATGEKYDLKHTILRFLNRSSATLRHSSDGVAGFLEVRLLDPMDGGSTDGSGVAYGLSTLVVRGSKFASRLRKTRWSEPTTHVTLITELLHTLQ